MAIFRYLSEADQDETQDLITNASVKDMTGLDVTQVLKIFLEYMHKYPELLEFPNGVQNIMTLFYNEIKYDTPLVT